MPLFRREPPPRVMIPNDYVKVGYEAERDHAETEIHVLLTLFQETFRPSWEEGWNPHMTRELHLFRQRLNALVEECLKP